jgi:glutathione S-transferase
MSTTPAALLSAIVTILAVLFVFYTGMRVARMRGKHGVHAPATAGHPEFERAYRVQMNTLEQFVIFLPLLWIATSYFGRLGWLAPALGLVWIAGRIVYMQGYMAAPEKRSRGFAISMIANLGLLILSIVGIVQNWIATNAS